MSDTHNNVEVVIACEKTRGKPILFASVITHTHTNTQTHTHINIYINICKYIFEKEIMKGDKNKRKYGREK